MLKYTNHRFDRLHHLKQEDSWPWWQYHTGCACYGSSRCILGHPMMYPRSSWRCSIVGFRWRHIRRPRHRDPIGLMSIGVRCRYPTCRIEMILAKHQWQLTRGQRWQWQLRGRFRFELWCQRIPRRVLHGWWELHFLSYQDFTLTVSVAPTLALLNRHLPSRASYG